MNQKIPNNVRSSGSYAQNDKEALITKIQSRLPHFENDFNERTYLELRHCSASLYRTFKERGLEPQADLAWDTFNALVSAKTNICWLQAILEEIKE